MASAQQSNNWSKNTKNKKSGDWHALRSDLVNLLNQVEGQLDQGSEQANNLQNNQNNQVEQYVEQADNNSAAQQVSPQPSNPAQPIHNPQYNNMSPSRQKIKSQTSASNNTALSSTLSNIANRLKRFEGNDDTPPQAIAASIAPPQTDENISVIAEQMEQLTQVVELLAGAVGETGQVKRLEAQIASLSHKIGEAPKSDFSEIATRIDSLAGHIKQLVEAQEINVKLQQNQTQIPNEYKDDFIDISLRIDALVNNVELLSEVQEKNSKYQENQIQENQKLIEGQEKLIQGQELIQQQAQKTNDYDNDFSDIALRIDSLVNNVEKLNEAQNQNTAILNDFEPSKHFEALNNSYENGLNSLTKSIGNIYDRFDELEKTSGLDSNDIERLFQEMAAITAETAIISQNVGNSQPNGNSLDLIEKISKLNDRLIQIENHDINVGETNTDLVSLKDMVNQEMQPHFSSLNSQIEALSNLLAKSLNSFAPQNRVEVKQTGSNEIERHINTNENASIGENASIEDIEDKLSQSFDNLNNHEVAKHSDKLYADLENVDDRFSRLEASLDTGESNKGNSDISSLSSYNEASFSHSEIKDPIASQMVERVAPVVEQNQTSAKHEEVTSVIERLIAEPKVNSAQSNNKQKAKIEQNLAIGSEEEPVVNSNYFSQDRAVTEKPMFLEEEAEENSQENLIKNIPDIKDNIENEFDELSLKHEGERARNFRLKSYAKNELNNNVDVASAAPALVEKSDKIIIKAKSANEKPLLNQEQHVSEALQSEQHDVSLEQKPSDLERPSMPISDFAPQARAVINDSPDVENVNIQAKQKEISSKNTFIEAARRAANRQTETQTKTQSSSLISKAFTRIQDFKSKKNTEGDDKPSKSEVKAMEKALNVAKKQTKSDDQVKVAEKSSILSTGKNLLLNHRRPILLSIALIVAASLAMNLVFGRTKVAFAPAEVAKSSDENPIIVYPTSPTVPTKIEPVEAEPLASETNQFEPAKVEPNKAEPASAVMSNESDKEPKTQTNLDVIATGAINRDIEVGSPIYQEMPRTISLSDAGLLTDDISTGSISSPDISTVSAIKLDMPDEKVGPLGLREAAANGNSRAQFEVAAIYSEGKAVAQNFIQASIWYERAAANGFAPAGYRLGGLYEKGQGVEKNLELARLWYQRSAEAGNRMAMHNLASIYASSEVGTQDFTTAIEWFERAANFGLTDSQFNLGMLYARGLGTKQNLETAYKWFLIAALNGDKDAIKARDDVARSLDSKIVADLRLSAMSWKQKKMNIEANFAPIGSWAKDFNPGKTINNQKIIKRVQAVLFSLGYDVGTPDGLMGPRTREAIKEFETETGMNPSGAINPRLLAVLGSQPV